jgi:sulfur-oxidizing protein SoxB
MTYPSVYRLDFTGQQLKDILEDVCDNLFNTDPFYQQGGDMVRVGGMDYICDPKAGAGQRISSMTLDDGTALEAARMYKVAGWATVNAQAPGPPIWDVVAEYLRDARVAGVGKLNTPVLRGVSSNPGIADYAGRFA